eukprot:scaffold157687_cov54-Attheya_sp.AAC.3
MLLLPRCNAFGAWYILPSLFRRRDCRGRCRDVWGAALGGGHLSGAVGGRGVTLGKYSMCGMNYYAKADDLVEVGERIKRARMEDPKDPCLALILSYPLFGIAAV